MSSEPQHLYRLLISCPDRPGIVAAVSGFLAERELNIIDSSQHSDQKLFMRLVFSSSKQDLDLLHQNFQPVATKWDMNYQFADTERSKRTVIMLSNEDHCLNDLLWRWRSKELEIDLLAVISNHQTHRQQVEALDLPYIHIPVANKDKANAETKLLQELKALDVDLVILARYMQILSADFLTRCEAPLINIHHSFLPAFKGAAPYEQAYERGVKVIGATAHYVTAELDDGPIIAQDVTPITHENRIEDLIRIGRDVERQVLARAVRAHSEDRVLLDGHRTVVF